MNGLLKLINDSEPTWHEARELAFKAFQGLKVELIHIDKAIGRVAAEDIVALCDLPTYTTSAMDGYVVAGSAPWEIIGSLSAGSLYKLELLEGQALGITTGSVIPKGSLGVLRWEDATVNETTLTGFVDANQDIRPEGVECKKGEILVYKGSTLTPSQVGLAAAAGIDYIQVFLKPKVVFVTLGDELQFQGVPINGLVRDSLGPQVPGWVALLGGEVIERLHVNDDYQSVINTLRRVVNECDFVITTGGTADGPSDFLRKALLELQADFVVDRVRVRPGHPMLLVSIKNDIGSSVPLLGLPGNPQSAIVALFSLGQPVFCALNEVPLPQLEKVITQDQLHAPTHFTRLVVGHSEHGKFWMSTFVGSAMLRGLAQSNGFAIALSGTTGVGQEVEWLPLR